VADFGVGVWALTKNRSSLEPSLGFTSGSLSDDTDRRLFADLRRTAEQLTAPKRWYRIPGHADCSHHSPSQWLDYRSVGRVAVRRRDIITGRHGLIS
jgi:hypothetical protein